ncbi:hypothetical protein [Thiobacillus sp.]
MTDDPDELMYEQAIRKKDQAVAIAAIERDRSPSPIRHSNSQVIGVDHHRFAHSDSVAHLVVSPLTEGVS